MGNVYMSKIKQWFLQLDTDQQLLVSQDKWKLAEAVWEEAQRQQKLDDNERLQQIDRKFKSANSCDVDRITIKRKDWFTT
jgi:hypothetical protein